MYKMYTSRLPNVLLTRMMNLLQPSVNTDPISIQSYRLPSQQMLSI